MTLIHLTYKYKKQESDFLNEKNRTYENKTFIIDPVVYANGNNRND